MRTLLKWTAIAAIPGTLIVGIPLGLAVWAWRRYRQKNAVIIVREPSTKFVVFRGGRA